MTSGKRRVLLLSSSTVHGSGYLEYAANDIDTFLKESNVSRILFVPYALRDHNKYTKTIQGYEIESIHKVENPVEAVKEAQAFYVGGGNTFQLLKALYDNGLVEPIRQRVLEDGVPYIGSSAGSNVATISICTTNDMPIVYPPSFSALGLVPFNINPHYLDVNPETHMGETREERINQYHEISGVPPVIGLREGSFLRIIGDKLMLQGLRAARIFVPGKQPEEFESGSDLSKFLNL
ncbi:Alpha-aspartyl dipeptidase [Blattella germanica]|nr:Alpha-aspartyl dipeptidase [Blattella germanica]